jgi:hypothetical protein
MEDEMFFAESVHRSKAMIQQTYANGIQRVGPDFALGDCKQGVHCVPSGRRR